MWVHKTSTFQSSIKTVDVCVERGRGPVDGPPCKGVLISTVSSSRVPPVPSVSTGPSTTCRDSVSVGTFDHPSVHLSVLVSK